VAGRSVRLAHSLRTRIVLLLHERPWFEGEAAEDVVVFVVEPSAKAPSCTMRSPFCINVGPTRL
jgi:hypothetical protein